jgi:hypothetical protein
MPQVMIDKGLTQGRIEEQIGSPSHEKVSRQDDPKESDAVKPKRVVYQFNLLAIPDLPIPFDGVSTWPQFLDGLRLLPRSYYSSNP